MLGLAGRIQEQEIMLRLLQSGQSEFLAMYGRRRIGKTYLIRHVYQNQMVFQVTGLSNSGMAVQLGNFSNALHEVFHLKGERRVVNSWFDAFEELKRYISSRKEKKKVLFFDELPWLDTPRSGFLGALEHFWNSWASKRKDILLVVCGSAASWMINKLINNKGGLHNRITQRILLQPFTLSETEQFLLMRNIRLNRYQITQLFMAMGGIPYYLNEVEQGKSAAQTIDKVCFTKHGILNNEFDNLYYSLFQQAPHHMAIVEALATKQGGLTRDELITRCRLPNGGTITLVLQELEMSGFITRCTPFQKKLRNSLYRLTDFYSLFYLKFIKNRKATGAGTWMNLVNTPPANAWSGCAFENVCMAHVPQIKKKLGISGVFSEVSSWSGSDGKHGAQIDLVIDRKDQVINLCEVKFSEYPFAVSKSYAAELRNKMSVFKSQTQTRKTIFLTLIASNGMKVNQHSTGLVQQDLSLDDLF